jgi:hypothetical protein
MSAAEKVATYPAFSVEPDLRQAVVGAPWQGRQINVFVMQDVAVLSFARHGVPSRDDPETILHLQEAVNHLLRHLSRLRLLILRVVGASGGGAGFHCRANGKLAGTGACEELAQKVNSFPVPLIGLADGIVCNIGFALLAACDNVHAVAGTEFQLGQDGITRTIPVKASLMHHHGKLDLVTSIAERTEDLPWSCERVLNLLAGRSSGDVLAVKHLMRQMKTKALGAAAFGFGTQAMTRTISKVPFPAALGQPMLAAKISATEQPSSLYYGGPWLAAPRPDSAFGSELGFGPQIHGLSQPPPPPPPPLPPSLPSAVAPAAAGPSPKPQPEQVPMPFHFGVNKPMKGSPAGQAPPAAAPDRGLGKVAPMPPPPPGLSFEDPLPPSDEGGSLCEASTQDCAGSISEDEDDEDEEGQDQSKANVHKKKNKNKKKPKRRDLSNRLVEEKASETVTSLMICNIPCCITQAQLKDVIDQSGFSETYDYMYLPTPNHMGSSQNLGYGFINFPDPADATLFMEAFDGFRFESTHSQKACTVRPAHVQGVENNLRLLRRWLKRNAPVGGGPFVRSAEGWTGEGFSG